MVLFVLSGFMIFYVTRRCNEAKENDYILTYPKQSIQPDLNKARRIVIHDYYGVGSERNIEVLMPNISPFLTFDIEFQMGIIYPLLRVLELEGCKNLKKLPKEFMSMIHLRYLGFAKTNLEQLPKTVGCLLNLQTLNIRFTRVNHIPSSLWKIQSLKHVIGYQFTGQPPLANLVNLQTLQGLCVSKSWKDQLHLLPSLRKLGVTNLNKGNIRNSVMPDWNTVITLLGMLNSLVSLSIEGDNFPAEIVDVNNSPSYQHLETLNLAGYCGYENPRNLTSRLSLDTIIMPQNLIELTLRDILFDKNPMPDLEKLPCVKSLTMESIANVEEMICSVGGFPQLQYLNIGDCKDLKQWKLEEDTMPMLKEFVIHDCKHLSNLPDFKHVKTLQKITISFLANVLKNKLKSRIGDEWQKIQHIPTVTIV